jgi:hypothetical protein
MGKLIAIGVALLVILIALIACFSGLVGKNDYADYQIKQSIGGDVIVIDTPGWYNRGFGTIYTYPRSVQAFYSKDVHEGGQADESIPVNFNDGGRAQVSVMVQFQMPSDADRRKKLHQTFGNVDAIKQAVRAHLINCVKNAGPMMSATENQAARKGEFNQVVEEQLRNGIYAMRRVEVELKDHATAAATTQSADNGSLSQPVRVMATEIVLDEKGQPVIVEPSPLKDYGITILQFSITGTDYDDATTAQFAAKQASFLSAEKSKAQREAEVQQTLMVEQQGLRQKAEVEASENVKKQQQVIQAQALAEVAMQTKLQAETAANQKVAVALLDKQAAETKANQDAQVLEIAAEQQLAIAKLKASQAEQEGKAIETLAAAEAKKISLAGALSEKERLQMNLDSQTRIGVAEAIGKLNVPTTIVNGGGEAGKGFDLMSMAILKGLGLLDFKPNSTTQPAPAPAH